MPESAAPVSTADATHTTITQNWVAPTDIYSIQLDDVTLGNISTVNTVLSLYDPSSSSYKEVSFALASNGNITELQIMYGPEKFDSSGVRLVIEDNDIAFVNIDGMIRHTGYAENGGTVTHVANDTFLEVDLVTSIVNELEIDIAVDDLTDLEYWDANSSSWLAISFGAGHKSTDNVGSNTILLLATGIDASRLRLTFSTGQAVTPTIISRQFSSKTANFGVSYIYDPLGRRVARLYDNITGKGNERGVYDGYQLIEERKLESNQLLKRFYYSSAVNGLILNEVDLNDDGVIDETNDGIYVPICDDRGSLVGVSDGTGSPNNIIERIYYNSTGIMRVYDGAGVIKKDSLNRDLGKSEFISFGWAGMYQEEFGLYHTHYREYDALHRRWLSEDPAGTVDGINLYNCYANVNSVDILGLDDKSPVDKADEAAGYYKGKLLKKKDGLLHHHTTVRSLYFTKAGGFKRARFSVEAIIEFEDPEKNRLKVGDNKHNAKNGHYYYNLFVFSHAETFEKLRKIKGQWSDKKAKQFTKLIRSQCPTTTFIGGFNEHVQLSAEEFDHWYQTEGKVLMAWDMLRHLELSKPTRDWAVNTIGDDITKKYHENKKLLNENIKELKKIAVKVDSKNKGASFDAEQLDLGKNFFADITGVGNEADFARALANPNGNWNKQLMLAAKAQKAGDVVAFDTATRNMDKWFGCLLEVYADKLKNDKARNLLKAEANKLQYGYLNIFHRVKK